MSFAFRTVESILDELVTQITGLQWTPSGGDPEAAFESVKRYDAADIEEAYSQLIVAGGRVCIVVDLGETWDGGTNDAVFNLSPTARRVSNLVIITSDAVIGDRRKAIYGSATNPGAGPLKDLVVAQIAGPLFPDSNHVFVAIREARPILAIDKNRKMSGRVAYELYLDAITPMQDITTDQP